MCLKKALIIKFHTLPLWMCNMNTQINLSQYTTLFGSRGLEEGLSF